MVAQAAPLQTEQVAKATDAPSSEQQPSDGSLKPANLTTHFMGLVGPLTSSLGVVAAVLYASGYLISVAQSHLLGLGRLVTFSHDHYVQQGGSFFIAVGSQAMQGAEIFSVACLIVAAPILGAYALGRWPRVRRIRWWPWRLIRLRALIVRRWRWIAYAVLLGLLFLLGDNPANYGCPLLPSNILFFDPNAVSASRCHKWTLGLLSNNSGAGVFEERLYRYLCILLLFLFSRFVTLTWTWRRLAVAPFTLLFLIYTILLPMLYGVLRMPVEFPEVEVRMSDNHPLGDKQRMFLLSRGDKEFILFAAGQRKVIWLRQERVENIEVKGIRPILDKSLAGVRDTQ